MPIDGPVERSKIRLGLGIVTVTFVIATVILLAVNDPVARLMMGLVMFLSALRAGLLVRDLRR